MEEKKLIYNMILDCWTVAKEYCFRPLSDDDWDHFIDKGFKLEKKYKKDEATLKLFCAIFNGLVMYKESKDGKSKKIHST